MSLQGKTIILVGTMSINRAEAKKRATAAGAKIGTTISGKTDIVVCGRAPGKKKAEAKNKGITIWNETQFMSSLVGEESAGDKRKAVPSPKSSVKKAKTQTPASPKSKKRKATSETAAQRKKRKQAQSDVLIQILNIAESPLKNWGSSLPLDKWEGVTVDKDGNITKLVLSDKKISGEFVRLICCNTNLSHVLLPFTALPKDIDNLSFLECLEMEKCGLERLPDNIGNLNALRELNVTGNSLKRIPESIGRLEFLTRLIFSDNSISTIPATLEQLKSLKTLSFSLNQITTIPDTITKLTKLEILNMFGNAFSSLPSKMGNLCALRMLNLHGSEMTSLPASLKQLSNLKHLIATRGRMRMTSTEKGKFENKLPFCRIVW